MATGAVYMHDRSLAITFDLASPLTRPCIALWPAESQLHEARVNAVFVHMAGRPVETYQ